jgi:NAD-dependent histone deacetylase SIR2
MGNESSTLVDENTHPSVLEARTVDAVAKYIKEKHVRRIVVMVRDTHYPSPASPPET